MRNRYFFSLRIADFIFCRHATENFHEKHAIELVKDLDIIYAKSVIRITADFERSIRGVNSIRPFHEIYPYLNCQMGLSDDPVT